MKTLFSFMTMIALLALAAPQAVAQQGVEKAKGKSGAEMERVLPDKAKDKMKKRGGDDPDDMADMDDEGRERAEEMREEAEERAEQQRELAQERAEGEEAAREGPRGQDNAATRGSEKSQEMRARRDERKQIMEEYKGKGEAGDAEAGMEADADEQAGERQQKAKKPWWKFWGD